MIKNLTAHTVTIAGRTIPPDGRVARVAAEHVPVTEVDGLPLVAVEYGDVVGLPDSEPGVTYLVSRMVAEASPRREDLVIPHGLVRDADGQPVSAEALTRVSARRQRHVVSTFTEQGDRYSVAADLTASEAALLRRLDTAGAGIRVDPAAHVETQLRTWLGKLAAEDAALEHTPDANGGWASRNELVRLVVRDARLVGFRAGYATDPDGHEGFRSVAWVELPTGQVSWHLPDFPHETDPSWVWDGHTRKEKADRIAAYLATTV